MAASDVLEPRQSDKAQLVISAKKFLAVTHPLRYGAAGFHLSPKSLLAQFYPI